MWTIILKERPIIELLFLYYSRYVQKAMFNLFDFNVSDDFLQRQSKR